MKEIYEKAKLDFASAREQLREFDKGTADFLIVRAEQRTQMMAIMAHLEATIYKAGRILSKVK